MKISGFTFVRNAVKLGYPARESIMSALPLVDEFIVALGDSEDDTRGLIESIDDPKVRIVPTAWNENMTTRGFVYGQQKTIAHYCCSGHWALYLESDEVLHEDDLPKIRATMETHLDNPEVEALVFDYLHFYGSPATRLDSPHWYRRAPRIIRNTIRAYSPDGLFFVVLTENKKGRYPRAVHSGATIYHYGWVRPETQMQEKFSSVTRYWGHKAPRIKYADVDPHILRSFEGSHPKAITEWLETVPRDFSPNPDYKLTKKDRKYRLKSRIEKLTGLDLSKKHFRLVK